MYVYTSLSLCIYIYIYIYMREATAWRPIANRPKPEPGGDFPFLI